VAYNPYIVIPLATWAVAQVAKFTLAALKGRIDFRYLYASGGMPSVHSAVVCSLAVTALLVGGTGSAVFGLAVILAAIVMYDSFGVRRSAGEQAAAINMLIDSLGHDRVKLAQPELRLREILGHQPSEVTAGAVVGVALGGLFNYQHLGPLFDAVQVTPSSTEMWAYAAVFAIIIIGGVAQKVILKSRYGKSPIIRSLSRRILAATQTVGWIGLAATLLQYERASYAGWRVWSWLMLAVGLLWGATIFFSTYKTIPAALATEVNQARKAKWLGRGSSRKNKRA